MARPESGPLRSRCMASTIASAVQNSRIQNAVPSEARAAGAAPAVSSIAAWPAANRMSSTSADPSAATIQLIAFVGGRMTRKNHRRDKRRDACGSTHHRGLPKVSTGRPETKRFGAQADEAGRTRADAGAESERQ